jgi:hypothetical protein
VINFVSKFRQDGVFFSGTTVSSTNKTKATPKMGTPPISSNFGQGQKLTPLRPPTVSEAPPVRNLSALSDVESQSNVKSDAKNVRTPGNSHTEDLESVKTKTEDKGT